VTTRRAPLELSVDQARRLAVIGQRLSLPRPKTIEEVVRDLLAVQMDPTSSVARTEHLVLWSRLGRRYRPAQLEKLLWKDKTLFEYRAYIVPTADFGLHREAMRMFTKGDGARAGYVARWLVTNKAFRRHVLARLRRDGPLRTRDIESRVAEGWQTGGWNDRGNDTAMMLETLWRRGEVMIVGRDGQERIWDLAERRLPVGEPRRPSRAVAREVLDRQLRAAGIEQISRFGYLHGSQSRPVGWERALAELVRDGVAVPARVEGVRGEWYAHGDVLSKRFRPRTALLSPFDQLIHDRVRTEKLWGFRYKLEIYVPPAKREYGYYVLPILFEDRLVGRLDPTFDRDDEVLRLRAVWAEPDAPAEAGPSIADEIADLAAWVGAARVEVGDVPGIWRRPLRTL
jgi:uncharacterized protein